MISARGSRDVPLDARAARRRWSRPPTGRARPRLAARPRRRAADPRRGPRLPRHARARRGGASRRAATRGRREPFTRRIWPASRDRVPAVRKLIAAAVMLAALAGGAAARAAPELSTSNRLDSPLRGRRHARPTRSAPRTAAFRRSGWHTRGEMGGIWLPPLKLLDGLWFAHRRRVDRPGAALQQRLRLRARWTCPLRPGSGPADGVRARRRRAPR